jgi:hypothetical protein
MRISICHAYQDGLVERRLAREVVVERGLLDADLLRDVLEVGPGESASRKLALGDIEDLVARVSASAVGSHSVPLSRDLPKIFGVGVSSSSGDHRLGLVSSVHPSSDSEHDETEPDQLRLGQAQGHLRIHPQKLDLRQRIAAPSSSQAIS